MTKAGPYKYRDEVLRQLLVHGVRPNATTSPDMVLEFVSDLYRFEIRRMRSRLLRGDFPRHEYFQRIVELRQRYRLVSLKSHDFVE